MYTRAYTNKTLLTLLAIGVFSLSCGPLACANSVSFSLTSNNLGISGSVDAITIEDTGMNQVTVTITMNSGFSLKLPGRDVAFSGPFGIECRKRPPVSQPLLELTRSAG